MCTPKESKLFIDTINQIPTMEIKNKFDIPCVEIFNEEFPMKDRDLSRRHFHTKEDVKKKTRNKKNIAAQRGMELYYAGLDQHGKLHKTRKLETSALNAELDFIKGSKAEPITETKDINWLDVFNCCYDLSDIIIKLNTLKANGIFLSEETEIELLNKASDRDAKRQRRFKLFKEREIVGYKVMIYAFHDESSIGVFPTKELANEYANLLREEGCDVEIVPDYMFTEEQAKELISLRKRS